MPDFPAVPDKIKPILHFLKVANEHETKNLMITYWSRMYAYQVALEIMADKKDAEVNSFLTAIKDWLKECKKLNPDLKEIHDAGTAQRLIKQYVLHLLFYAEGQDRIKQYGKNIVKAFYTCGILMDVLQQFGYINTDMLKNRKYAKNKAAYIHHCLLEGVEPLPGPIKQCNSLDDRDEEEVAPVIGPEVVLHKTPPSGFTPIFSDQTNIHVIHEEVKDDMDNCMLSFDNKKSNPQIKPTFAPAKCHSASEVSNSNLKEIQKAAECHKPTKSALEELKKTLMRS